MNKRKFHDKNSLATWLDTAFSPRIRDNDCFTLSIVSGLCRGINKWRILMNRLQIKCNYVCLPYDVVSYELRIFWLAAEIIVVFF